MDAWTVTAKQGRELFTAWGMTFLAWQRPTSGLGRDAVVDVPGVGRQIARVGFGVEVCLVRVSAPSSGW